MTYRGRSNRFLMAVSMFIGTAAGSYVVGGNEAISHDIFIPRLYFLGHLFFYQGILETNELVVLARILALFYIWAKCNVINFYVLYLVLKSQIH